MKKKKSSFHIDFQTSETENLKKKYFSFCCYLPIKHIDQLSNYLKIFHDEEFKKKLNTISAISFLDSKYLS